MKQLISVFLTSLLLTNQAQAESQLASYPVVNTGGVHSNAIPEPTPIQTIELTEHDLYAVQAVPVANPEEFQDQKAVQDPSQTEAEIFPLAANESPEAPITSNNKPTASNYTPTERYPVQTSQQTEVETVPQPVFSEAATAPSQAEAEHLNSNTAPSFQSESFIEPSQAVTEAEVNSTQTLTISEADIVPVPITTPSEPEAAQPPREQQAESSSLQFANQISDTKTEPGATPALEVDMAPPASNLTLSAPSTGPIEDFKTFDAQAPVAEASEPPPTEVTYHGATNISEAASQPPSEPLSEAVVPPVPPLPGTFQEKTPVQAASSAPQTEVIILKNPENLGNYMLSPGDALEITVWKEEGLQQLQFLIGPDGNIIFPLIGTITAAGRTLNDLKELITFKLSDYIADPSISIKLINNQGNAVFVIGKVNKPGQVIASRRIDVLQALSLAGGLTVFADEGNITVQRRVGDEVKVFPFDYGDVIDGDHLEQNILLEPGDTIAVP